MRAGQSGDPFISRDVFLSDNPTLIGRPIHEAEAPMTRDILCRPATPFNGKSGFDLNRT